MDKLRTRKELQDFRSSLLDAKRIHEKELGNVDVKVGMGTCGNSAGAEKTMADMVAEAEKRGLTQVAFAQTGCMGYCHSEPTVSIKRPGEEPVTFGNVKDLKTIQAIFDHYILKGELTDGILPLASEIVR